MIKPITKQVYQRRMRVGYSLLIRTPDHSPAQFHKSERMYEVFTNLSLLLMGSPINLNNNFIIEQSEVRYMAQTKERVLGSIALA